MITEEQRIRIEILTEDMVAAEIALARSEDLCKRRRAELRDYLSDLNKQPSASSQSH